MDAGLGFGEGIRDPGASGVPLTLAHNGGGRVDNILANGRLSFPLLVFFCEVSDLCNLSLGTFVNCYPEYQ